MSYRKPEQIDRAEHCPGVKKQLKKAQVRKERLRARRKPEAPPEYGKYREWSL